MTLKMLPAEWRQIQRKNFTHWESLANFLQLNDVQRAFILKRSHFPLNLPLRLAQKIEKGTLEDPILKQFLPLVEEQLEQSGFSTDPIKEKLCKKTKKLLHKYQGRVLLVCTSSCAMHCRYCFRRHFDYAVKDFSFEDELAYIAGDATIKEVILSGGDPLSLSNTVLKKLIDRLNQIPHLKKLRFHSRFPLGIPERIDYEFLEIIKNSPLQIFFVVHVNHPKELDSTIFLALKNLQMRGVVLLNQSVLLKGINDQVAILYQLYEELSHRGIMPYYLHQLDRVAGGAHFEVSEAKGIALINELRAQLPGYAVPLYVRETGGQMSKTPIFASHSIVD